MISNNFSTNQVTLKPSDFDPPLKRKEPTVPGYWTLEEIAAEIGMTPRKIRYDVTGRPEHNLAPSLKAYKVGKSLLVSEADALEYIFKQRTRNKS
ncbi:MAG: hypothetical protein AB4038_05835 [Prochloraceae cyanobacterium]